MTAIKLLGMIILLVFITSCGSFEMKIDSSETDNTKTEFYEPNVLAATMYQIEDEVNGVKIQKGVRLEVLLEDNSTDVVVYNFSKPQDIGTGTDTMIINGILDRAYTEQSLECFQQLHNIYLNPITREEAININNPNGWIWINNIFYEFLTPLPEDYPANENCSFEGLRTYQSGDYTSPSRTFPRKVTVKLLGDIERPFFSKDEIRATILLNVYGDPKPKSLHTEYFSTKGKQSCNLDLENDTFLFDKSLKLQSKYPYLFPLDFPYAEIFNIDPSIITEKTLAVNGDLLNLRGTAYFTKDRIEIKFHRKVGNVIYIFVKYLLLIYFIHKLNNSIKYSRKTLSKIDRLKKIAFGYVIPIVGSITIVTLSYKFLFTLIMIVPLIMFINLSKTIIKKYFLKKKEAS